MTLHRELLDAAATLNLTGALSRETLVPDWSLPLSVPSATTPLGVARKLVILALIEREDDVAASAVAGMANATIAASAASMAEWGFMSAGVPARNPTQPAGPGKPPGPAANAQSAPAIRFARSYSR